MSYHQLCVESDSPLCDAIVNNEFDRVRELVYHTDAGLPKCIENTNNTAPKLQLNEIAYDYPILDGIYTKQNADLEKAALAQKCGGFKGEKISPYCYAVKHGFDYIARYLKENGLDNANLDSCAALDSSTTVTGATNQAPAEHDEL